MRILSSYNALPSSAPYRLPYPRTRCLHVLAMATAAMSSTLFPVTTSHVGATSGRKAALKTSAQCSSMRPTSSVASALRSDFVARDSLKVSHVSRSRGMSTRAGPVVTCFAADPAQLKGAEEMITELLKSKSCSGILIRLGWHDAGTYDKSIAEWPARGGANGSLRFHPESGHKANAGLLNAVELLKPIREKFPNVSYADLFQLASATAIELAGGPKIPMRYGRVDARGPQDCHPEGNLPAGDPPKPADHLRTVFYRMGLNDKEIVALSGAHTMGRSFPNRSGFGKESTKYTENGPGTKGGQSWTIEWLKFDNQYFADIKEKKDADLLVLPTDAVIFEDAAFKVYAEKYAVDQDAFFADYALAHKKLSEQGAQFDPPEGIVIDGSAPKKFSAAEYSVNASELSDTMKQKIRAEYLAVGGSANKPLSSNYFLNIIIGISVIAILTKLTGGF